MRLEVVRAIAKSYDINPGKRSKNDLIKVIQVNEGNFDCFATACQGVCDQIKCLWRTDCLGMAYSN